MVSWLICPKCGEVYYDQKMCHTCLVETIPTCPFCEKAPNNCVCRFSETTSIMLQSPYIRKAFIEGLVKGLYKEAFKNISLILIYGSLERDIDLLIVNNAARTINFTCWKIQSTLLDIIELSESKLIGKLKFLDPVYTEPVLTGESCFGDPQLFTKLKETIHQAKPNRKVLLYLFNEGMMLFNCALSMLSMWLYENNVEALEKSCLSYLAFYIDEILHPKFKKEGKHIRSSSIETAIINLAFSCSYLAFCKHYLEKEEIITYQKLLESNELLREINDYKKKIVRGEKPDLEHILSIARKVKNMYKDFEISVLPRIVGLPYWSEGMDDKQWKIT